MSGILLAGNPLSDDKGDEFKKFVLINLFGVLEGLKTINGDPFTKEDIDEAITEKESLRIEAEEKKRKLEAVKM